MYINCTRANRKSRIEINNTQKSHMQTIHWTVYIVYYIQVHGNSPKSIFCKYFFCSFSNLFENLLIEKERLILNYN